MMSINKQTAIIALITTALFLLTMFYVDKALSQQETKLCINHQSGEIIAVRAGFPCPSPTVEL